jgi:hypothetical protein
MRKENRTSKNSNSSTTPSRKAIAGTLTIKKTTIRNISVSIVNGVLYIDRNIYQLFVLSLEN